MAANNESPRKHANVQEMIQHRSDQMKAEDLARRLCLLRRKEMEQKQDTEQTYRMAQELSQRREKDMKRVREKEEGLRKLRALYQIGVAQKPKNPNADSQVAECDPLMMSLDEAEDAVDQQDISCCGVRGSSDNSVLRSARGMGTGSPSLVKSSLKSPMRNTGATKSSDTHFSRFPTADMMHLGYAQGAMVNRGAGADGHKVRLGAYAFDGNRLWMSPKGFVGATGATQTEKSPRKGPLSRTPPKLEPKELVRQLAKKERELQDRLDAAKYAHELAEKDLENSFKSFTAVQVSARKAIREGNY
mmetsp:Transcript_48917/g.77249  ORF Transcript_48917/g.77249 Transcript_48917/m.77249 type:complete len:303 (-) Transcript_48917:44-952(-)